MPQPLTSTITLISHIHELDEAIKAQLNGSSAVMIRDHTVSPFSQTMVDALISQTHILKVIDIEAGESLKTLKAYGDLCDEILSLDIHRHCILIALGGGTVTDMVGFMAATVLRGLSWIVIPTTLTGMIDAAIGGKVGINTQAGKNLLGSFHQPHHHLICTEFLSYFQPLQFMHQCGEIIKYALLDAKIRSLIQAHCTITDPQLIRLCVQLKANIVQNDPYETSSPSVPHTHPRIGLNCGHTLAHGLEMVYGMNHSDAVIIGLILEPYLCDPSDQARFLPQSHRSLECVSQIENGQLKDHIIHTLHKLARQWLPSQIERYLRSDKKKNSQGNRLVFAIHDQVHIHDISENTLSDGLKHLFNRYSPSLSQASLPQEKDSK